MELFPGLDITTSQREIPSQSIFAAHGTFKILSKRFPELPKYIIAGSTIDPIIWTPREMPKHVWGNINKEHKENFSAIMEIITAWKLSNACVYIHPEIYANIDPLTDEQVKIVGEEFNRNFPYWAIFLSLPQTSVRVNDVTGHMDGIFVINWNGRFKVNTEFSHYTDAITGLYLGETGTYKMVTFFRHLFPYSLFLETEEGVSPYDDRKVFACLAVALNTINQHRQSLSITRPSPIKTKHGKKFIFADTHKTISVGFAIGDRIVSTRTKLGGKHHSSPCPHIRRAHWHTYLTGPKKNVPIDQRKRLLKWIPPISVAMWDKENLS